MNQYEQKLNKMLNRLKETNFAAFDGDSDLALESIADNLSQFTNYHNQIIYEKTQTPILKANVSKSAEDVKDDLESLHRGTMMALDVAHQSAQELNNLSKKLGLEPFAEYNSHNKVEVADFISDYTREMFGNGLPMSMQNSRETAYAPTMDRESLETIMSM